MKKKLIIMTALAFCLGAFSAATGTKEMVQAYTETETEIETETPAEKKVCELTSDALRDKSVIIGRTQTFSIENQMDFDYDSWEYVTPKNVTWSVTGNGVSIVSQAADGLTYEIKAESVGTATISVTYDMEYATNIYRYTSTATISSIEKPITERTSYALSSKSGYVGNSWTFSLENEKEWDYDSQEYVTPQNVTWSVTGDAISIVSQESNGLTFTVSAAAIGTATVTVTYDMEYYNNIYRCTSTATITITEKPVYEENSYVLKNQTLLKGKAGTFSIEDVAKTDGNSGDTVKPKNVKWSVKGEAASITSKKKTGTSLKVKAAAEGEATISVTYDMEYSDGIYRYTATATIYVSNPKLETKTLSLNKYNSWTGGIMDSVSDTVKLTGMKSGSTVTCTSKSKNITITAEKSWRGDYWNIEVTATKKGTYNVKVNADGKILNLKVVVTAAYFKRSTAHSVDTMMDKNWYEGSTTLVLDKGAKETLTVKGLSSGTKIKWSSSNKKVATVNQKGVVLGKGNGYCTISATFNGVSITYEVGVASKTAVKAVYYAIKHFGSIYSQPQRMAVGKYDCSSYVFRSYLDAGKTLGTSSKWAPTAASLAQWCNEKGYVLYWETDTVDFSKLLPGDLIFETGENNGRYKGIYHVDLYVGNGYTLTVQRTKYWGDSDTSIIVARPCK